MTMHRQHEAHYQNCPIRDVLNRLGDRWTVLVMLQLGGGVQRFSEVRRNIPDISPRMLSQTLRHLEQDGLVARTAYASVPPRVDYALTDLGESFMGVVQVMLDWAKTHQTAVHSAREAYSPPEKFAAK